MYEVYGHMGNVDSLDRDAILDCFDFPPDYPSHELMVEGGHDGVYFILDKTGECVGVVSYRHEVK